MGLPRVCRVKKCRQRKRCFGLGLICLDDHPALARDRFTSAMRKLGWAKTYAEEEARASEQHVRERGRR